MELNEMTLQDVQERLAALDVEVRAMTTAEAVDQATEEKKLLLERRAELEALETRKQNALDLQSGKITPDKVIEERKDEKMMDTVYTHESAEFRSAWLKQLQGKPLSDIEQRAIQIGDATGNAVLPSQTANLVIEKLMDMVPMLGEIELFRYPGTLSVPVEVSRPTTELKRGGEALTEKAAVLKSVTLGGYTINTLLRIGADLTKMSVSAFEEWLVRKISEGVAYQIENYIINGTGSDQPTGIEKYAVWDVSNGTGVDWTGGSSNDALAVKDLDTAAGLLPAAYDRESKYLMSKKTFYTHVANLTDQNHFPVINKEGTKFYLRGYPVIFSDQVAANVIYFGSFKRGMVGNLGVDINVERQRNLAYNSWDFLGWGVFDCKPAADGCIVKIASDIQA